MKFRTVAAVANIQKVVLLNETRTVLHLCNAKEYHITAIHADQEFRCIREEVILVELNICATDDHVSEVERSVRTIKEQVRCTMHGLPFKKISRVM